MVVHARQKECHPAFTVGEKAKRVPSLEKGDYKTKKKEVSINAG